MTIERVVSTMAKNPWTEYYAAKSQLEKEEILKRLYPGISEEGLAIFRRKYTPEELVDFVKEFTSPESYPPGYWKNE